MNHLQELVVCRKLAQVLEKVVHRPRETEDAISGELLVLELLQLLLFLVRHSGDELVQQHRDAIIAGQVDGWLTAKGLAWMCWVKPKKGLEHYAAAPFV